MNEPTNGWYWLWSFQAFSELQTIICDKFLEALQLLENLVARVVKNPPANAGDIRDAVLFLGSGRSSRGRHCNPLQYSCLENPMDIGAWQPTVHGIAKSWKPLRRLSTNCQNIPKLKYSRLRHSLVAQMVKELPAMWEMWVWSLGWEDPLEEGIATNSSILAWRIPMDRGAWQATVHRVTKSWTWLSN